MSIAAKGDVIVPVTNTRNVSEESKHDLVIPAVRSWLEENHEKIESFWMCAEWRMWARFDLYATLEKARKRYFPSHSRSEFWDKDRDEEVDIVIEPETSSSPIAIVLCCENVKENEGSFEDFVKRWDGVWSALQNLGPIDNEFEGASVLLVGLGGEPRGNNMDEFNTRPPPETFNCGDVWCFYKAFIPPE